MKNKLSIAFIWHMHQPMYKPSPNKDYLMPWIRLHAVKDYLDMLLIMDEFPKLKLNFNLVPLLLDMINDYANNNAHDIHSQLLIKPIEKLTKEDKFFILNNFFDANYQNMIVHHEYYSSLYKKRFSKDNITINDFSLQEYEDIMVWFNLAWMDPIWKKEYSQIQDFVNKEKNFNLSDRKIILEIQRDIMRKIIPAYKKYQDEGRIEISTSPYYHPILPLLLDANTARASVLNYPISKDKAGLKKDAKKQIEMALNKLENIFGKRPQGIWPSEHCISPQTIDLLIDCGVRWTISDEGILSKTTKTEFVRDFKGNLASPYELCNVYNLKDGEKSIDVIFRDSVIPNIISFEYPRFDQTSSANDLYERIKHIQNKLASSPEKNHLLTIAMDGENCWENFEDDGQVFLKTLYSLLENDKTLETTTISEFLDKKIRKTELNNIASGSWINRDFQLWISEPTKNLAWTYLFKTKEDFDQFSKLTKDKNLIEKAQNELFIAESSDWFWWYGEPNNSGQDHVFDYLFRSHLKNVYKIFKKPAPGYLDTKLTDFLGKPSRYPKKKISPTIDGKITNNNEWKNAGCIELPAGPVLKVNKFFNKIYFGSDKNNLYLRFNMNNVAFENASKNSLLHELYIYIKNQKGYTEGAAINPTAKTNALFPILKEKFNYEIKLMFFKNEKLPFCFAYTNEDRIWVNMYKTNIKYKKGEIIEISIPFEDINVDFGEKAEVFMISTAFGIIEEFFPQDMLLTTIRTK